jgi:hypothetical protein
MLLGQVAQVRTIVTSSVLVALLVTLLAGALDSGFVRSAGWPTRPSDLEGAWVLDRVRGQFPHTPPQRLLFTVGDAPDLVRVSDGSRSVQFQLMGGGLLRYDPRTPFEPLLPSGRTEVRTMTHLCPPLPAWDHLIFHPDGVASDSATPRSIRYERD